MLDVIGILLIGLCFVSLIYFAKENDMLNMNLFRVFKKDNQSQDSVLSQWSNELDYPEDAYLTQAELQQLTKAISEVIEEKEFQYSESLYVAKFFKDYYPKGVVQCYKECNKIRKQIKKLAKIQYKLKHKLKTKG